ncbi:hypothetical protein CHS0354_009253 [Potamilus streckersoni]|uniref:palmitoyl-CoA hydrolase n=1 Tax=Potamilus streckersoni TaxID=2493646 RepID=A0AAE0SIZ0_9BIVA|nr:hypothetical protein CHS0354_009253 [Potamilus streckersoni]
MWKQVDFVGIEMLKIMALFPDGVHLICFSQGGLLCRAVLEKYPHNVDSFISLSAPQSGQFGDTDYLKFFYPNFIKDNLYKILYSEEGQKVSVGNYWNDPHQQEMYENYSDFLAVINNQTSNPDSQEFKSNFLRLKHLVMIGGPDDGVITPWQSSHFGFYNSAEEIVEMEEQKWYINDSFGLRTLDKRKGLTKYVIPGVHHVHWHTNRTVFDCCIEPWLT